MFRTSSFFGPRNSGFVPFASGAPVDAPAEDDLASVESAEGEAAAALARAAAPVGDAVPHAVAPWAPAASAHVRVVEGAVLAAICAYFGWGLLSAFGLF